MVERNLGTWLSDYITCRHLLRKSKITEGGQVPYSRVRTVGTHYNHLPYQRLVNLAIIKFAVSNEQKQLKKKMTRIFDS